MTDNDFPETRLRHVEEQIEGLAADVADMRGLVKDFLGETATLNYKLLETRRRTATAIIGFLSNFARMWLRDKGVSHDRGLVARECLAYLTRRWARAKGEIALADDPFELITPFGQDIDKYFAKRGLEGMFVEE